MEPYSGPKYTKNYVEVLPEPGLICPDCQTGVIKQGKFSPFCPECKCFFIKQGGFQRAVPEVSASEQKSAITGNGTDILYEDIKKTLIKMLEKFITTLKEE